jgi:hypothetical protein
VLPDYEPVEPSYGSTTTGSRHVAGPLGDDVLEGEPQYGQNLGTDRI